MSGYGEPRQRCRRCDQSIAARQMTNHKGSERCRKKSVEYVRRLLSKRGKADCTAAIGYLIGTYPKDWISRCHEIAERIRCAGLVADDTAKLRYGHWNGPISNACVVESWISSPIVRHGWIEIPADDGQTIIDPTRWVFEAAPPYVYVGRNDHYDAGGNQLREVMRQPCPNYSATDARASIQVWRHSPAAHRFVMDELFGGAPGVTVKMMRWLANAPLQHLGQHAAPIYRAVEEAGARAHIPIDNYEAVMGFSR